MKNRTRGSGLKNAFLTFGVISICYTNVFDNDYAVILFLLSKIDYPLEYFYDTW